MELNQTPVRTSKNFGINNIKLDLEIPENVQEFKNMQISKTTSKLEKNLELKYGTGMEYANSNNKIQIQANNKDDIKLTYNFDDENLNLINQVEIIANGISNITIEYRSNTKNKCFHNGIIKLLAKENAKVNITIINFLNKNSDNIESIENILEENSKVDYTIIDIGGKNSVTNYYSNILGENANNNLKTIYLASEGQVKDLNYIAELRGIKTNIDIDVQGALTGDAKKHFKGTIDFKKGCKKAKGNENEYCMLLSKNAKSIALPMLLCTEDDVEGNHSTASGKVDKNQLLYIMSRGLSYKEAVKLIVKANFNKILDRIKDEDLKEEIINEIDNRLE